MFDAKVTVAVDLKSSEEWFKTKRFKEVNGKEVILKISKYTGWDVVNQHKSWYKEKITEEEFDKWTIRKDLLDKYKK